MNIMDIEGHKAAIAYDPDINLYRGEFIELNGDADFYGADAETLRKEGEASLHVFLTMCQKKCIEPCHPFSGKFNGARLAGTARQAGTGSGSGTLPAILGVPGYRHSGAR